MPKTISLIKKYPLTTVLVAAIWVVCIIPIPDTPLSHVNMMDKWTHIVMYFVLSIVIAYERQRRKKVKGQLSSELARLQSGAAQVTAKRLPEQELLIYSFLLPTLMGGLLELVQAYCTGGTRSGDWIDFFADMLGCALGTFICILLARCRAKGGRDCGASDDCRNEGRQ